MARGVTLTRLADALDTTPTTVSRWLAGRHTPPPELFGAIAAFADHELADEVAKLARGEAEVAA